MYSPREAKHATRGSLTDLPAGVSSMVSLVLDPSHDVAALQITGFNPRPRTGSDRGTCHFFITRIDLSFNPRPRTGSDAARTWSRDRAQRVSIRAPARGATN